MTTIRYLLIMATAALLGCQTTTVTKPFGSGPLRVGVTDNSQPLIYKRGGEIVGLEADLANALAKQLGRPIKFVLRAWDELIPSLQRGEIDIVMSGMSITPARDTLVSFTQPYMEIGQMAVYRLQDTRKYPNIMFVLGTHDRVGVEAGTTSDFFLQQVMYKAERVSFSSVSKAVDALLANKVSLVLSDAPTALLLASENEARGLDVVPQLLTREQLAWAVSRADPALLDAANRMLSAWKQDGRLKAALQRWIPYYDKLQQALPQ